MRENNHTFLKILLVLLALVGISFAIFYKQIKQTVVLKGIGPVIAENTPLSEEEVQDIISVLSKEDQEVVSGIIAEHLTIDTVSTVQDYVEEQDVIGLESYIESELSDDEMNEIVRIANENEEGLSWKLSQYGVDYGVILYYLND